MCRVTMGHLRVTVGHSRVTIGHPRVIVFAFLFVSKLKANTTELHPKVRPTCYNAKAGGSLTKLSIKGNFHSLLLLIQMSWRTHIPC